MIRINLLPAELREKGKSLDWAIAGYAAIGFLALIVFSIYFVKLHDYKLNLEKKARWNQQLAELRAKVAQVEQLDAQKAVLIAKKNTVSQLFEGRLLYPKFMEKIFETLPADVWLSDLSISEDPQRHLKVSAVSNSLSADSIADWLQTLESSPERFADVQLSAIDVKPSQDPNMGFPSYSFSMNFAYHPPPMQAGL